MDKFHAVLVMTLLGILQFLVLIIVHHLTLIVERIIFVLSEGSTDDINCSIGTTWKNFSINFSKQRQKFA